MVVIKHYTPDRTVQTMSNGDMDNQVVSYDWLIEQGFNHFVAEALVGRELTYRSLSWTTGHELFEHVLEWNGIIGYSSTIRDALDNIRNMEAL